MENSFLESVMKNFEVHLPGNENYNYAMETVVYRPMLACCWKFWDN